MFKGSVVVALAAAWLVLGAAPASAAGRPVPSLEPAKTAKLWTKLVRHRRPFALDQTSDCRPLRAVFYTATDWLRLATKLAASASPCADYFISIPPISGDKTTFRYDQPWRIRALGPNFHVLAEIHMNAWANWVANNGGSWYAAGVEARRRMAASGFDVASGDSWIVNELGSLVRSGGGTARTNVRELVRGLYDGDGGPAVKGGVYIIGMAQGAANLSTYQGLVQSWYEDTPFWNDMASYVSDWSQELYGDVRRYAVGGASIQTRRDALDTYLQHGLVLANAGPEEIAPARSFLRAAYSPLANAAWQYESAFGWTAVPYIQMEDYVSAQTYALRSFAARSGRDADHFGFAWSPKAPLDMTSADFATQTGVIANRLAAAMRDSAQQVDAANPGIGACLPDWCSTTVAGASFNPVWNTLATWAPDALGFGAAVTAIAGNAAGPLTVQLRVAGVPRAESVPVTVTLVSSSSQGAFAPTADGPWTATLEVTIPAGATGGTFYYRDTAAGTARLEASAPGRVGAAQLETVVAGPTASLALSPSAATIPMGASQTFTAGGTDAYGNPTAPAPTWSVGIDTPGSVSSTGTFTASPSAGGSGTVVATVGTVTASASVTVIA